MEDQKIGADYVEIASHFKSAYVNARDKSLLLVENPNGYAVVINRARGFRTGEYQASVEIKPNTRTGSSVGITTGEWDSLNLEALLKLCKEYNGGLRQDIYNADDRATVQFLTIEQAVNQMDNILGYTLV